MKLHTIAIYGLLLAALLVGIEACVSHGEPFGEELTTKDLLVRLAHPDEGHQWSKNSQFEIEFIERNTSIRKKVTTKEEYTTVALPMGYYSVNIQAHEADENGTHYFYRGYSPTLIVDKNSCDSLRIMMNRANEKPSPLVIAEIFPTGTLTPDGKQFDEDKYLVLYNQSADTLYLDGICISTSPFLQNLKIKPIPDIAYKATAADAILQIPGSGKEYPLPPHHHTLISDNANNHLEGNPLSWDATISDFEFFWPGEHDDIDNPEVPNLLIQYSFIVMNNQASQTFFVWKLPKGLTMQQYLNDYKYYFYWMFIQGDITVKMEENEYCVPNEWILDAVNLCPTQEFEWISTSPTVDCSYTYCTDIGLSNNRYRNAVIRKKSQLDTLIYQDSNNSAEDFIPQIEASQLRSTRK